MGRWLSRSETNRAEARERGGWWAAPSARNRSQMEVGLHALRTTPAEGESPVPSVFPWLQNRSRLASAENPHWNTQNGVKILTEGATVPPEVSEKAGASRNSNYPPRGCWVMLGPGATASCTCFHQSCDLLVLPASTPGHSLPLVDPDHDFLFSQCKEKLACTGCVFAVSGTFFFHCYPLIP